MLIRNIPTYLILVALFLLAQACVSSPQKSLYKPRYLTDGRHYTFAIYNSDNLLITHPYEDWKRAYLQAEKEGEPYTDLYVVSHGWNFTHQEAMANYYSHIQMLDNFLPAPNLTQTPNSSATHSAETPKFCPEKHYDNNTNRCKFKPYFIFVVWNSTSRPLSESAYSILPFGAEDTTAEILRIVDQIAFHIPSTWKQSINASRNAVGKGISIENSFYLHIEKENRDEIQEQYEKYSKLFGQLQRKYYFFNCTPYTSRKHLLFSKEHLAGRELPLAVLLAQIIRPNKEFLLQKKTNQKIQKLNNEIKILNEELEKASSFNSLLNIFSTKEQRLDSLKKERLATEELLRNDNFLKACQDTPKAYEPKKLKVHLVGHSFGAKLVALAGIHGINIAQIHDLLSNDPTQQTQRQNTEIASLILFQPAFHAFELETSLGEKINVHSTLINIPKKAIIYSNTDYATGFLFESSQKLINYEHAQIYDRQAYRIFDLQRKSFYELYEFLYQTEFKLHVLFWPLLPYIELTGTLQGFYTIGRTVISSVPSWIGKTIVFTGFDFAHHLKNNWESGCKVFNPVHFFIPLDKLYPLNIWTSTNLDADLQGIWRGVDTGLGRSGLENMIKGRPIFSSSPNLYKFANREKSPKPLISNSETLFSRISCFNKTITNQDININFNDEELKELAIEEIKKGANMPEDFKNLSFFNNPNEFFSIDGSSIYDTAWVPFIGSHGDLRDDDRSSACQNLFKILKPGLQAKIKQEHRNIETEKDEDNISKRHATFNFIMKFTQGELVEMEPANLP